LELFVVRISGEPFPEGLADKLDNGGPNEEDDKALDGDMQEYDT
jgi:hypothetical protein